MAVVLLLYDFSVGIMHKILKLLFKYFSLSTALLSYFPLYEPYAPFKLGQFGALTYLEAIYPSLFAPHLFLLFGL